MKPALTCFVSGALFLLGGIGYSQNTSRSGSKSQPVYRLAMTECQSDQINDCITWTFLSLNGWKGSGKWRTGEEAFLQITSVRNGTITIDRTDVTGSKAGLTATYTGTIHDDRLIGEFQFRYQGHDGSGSWYATIGTPKLSLPTVMHFCGQWCATFTLENGKYPRTAGGANNGSFTVMTIDKFTPESVVMHRVDTGTFSGNIVYSGRMSDDLSSLSGDGWKITWGDALDTIPGSGLNTMRGNGQPQTGQITSGDIIEGIRTFNTLAEALKNLQYFLGDQR